MIAPATAVRTDRAYDIRARKRPLPSPGAASNENMVVVGALPFATAPP
jgi:hypothetical protein